MTKTVSKISLAVVCGSIVAFGASCGHKKISYNAAEATASSETDGKGLITQVIWLKPKKDTIDLKVSLTNHYAHDIAFKRSAVRMTFNGVNGVPKKNDLTGDLPAGATESAVLIFEFDRIVAKKGTVVLTIDPITGGAGEANEGKKIPAINLELPVK
ncbi:MAG: hypothetical protein H7222_11615 [Methylotenera sp.]|nr:hypothetical protein [Oligoflexia bacterium]